MDIAIIDCRYNDGRVANLGGFLSQRNYRVDTFHHVNFQEQIGLDWNVVKSDVFQGAHKFGLIILHVGPDQRHAEKALVDGFVAKNVICFTGANIPDYCRVDCRKNTSHCYIPAGSIPQGNTWPEFWKRRILEYLRLLEQGKPEDARNLIMGYDPDLERVLNTLSKEFCDFLAKNATPTADQLRNFAISIRDPKFDEWAKTKAAKEAERERASRP